MIRFTRWQCSSLSGGRRRYERGRRHEVSIGSVERAEQLAPVSVAGVEARGEVLSRRQGAHSWSVGAEVRADGAAVQKVRDRCPASAGAASKPKGVAGSESNSKRIVDAGLDRVSPTPPASLCLFVQPYPWYCLPGWPHGEDARSSTRAPCCKATTACSRMAARSVGSRSDLSKRSSSTGRPSRRLATTLRGPSTAAGERGVRGRESRDVEQQNHASLRKAAAVCARP